MEQYQDIRDSFRSLYDTGKLYSFWLRGHASFATPENWAKTKVRERIYYTHSQTLFQYLYSNTHWKSLEDAGDIEDEL